jgi:hypothetical protein
MPAVAVAPTFFVPPSSIFVNVTPTGWPGTVTLTKRIVSGEA